MKSLLFTIVGVVFCFTGVFSQDDSTRYIFGIPVDANDTVQNFPNDDLQPESHLRPVPAYSLPTEVLEELKKPQYKGWQDSIVYFQKNTRLYLVPVKYDKGIKIFGLNPNGKPVTYDEVGR